MPCGARIEPDGDIVGLPVSGPCEACLTSTGDDGAHAPEIDGRLVLLCRSCCPTCRGSAA